MSVVKINALTVPPEQWDVLEQRFAARAGEVDSTPGFESFQLLRPTDDSHRWFVVTQWSTEQAFEDWMASRAFQQGHAQAGGDAADESPSDDQAPPAADDTPSRPAASGAELLSFEVVQSSTPQQET